MTDVVVVTGAGGVGKTTISAALAAVAAGTGRRCLVATVDPARRLGDVLGLDVVGNQPAPVPSRDGLWAAMLDARASWDAIVHRHAEPEVAARLEVNPYFRAIADRFPAAQAYAAAEQMAEYAESGAWDLLVVDTPPARGGLDFYVAPQRMREFIGGRVLRLVTGARLPGRRTLYNLTTRPLLRMTDSILGSELLEEIADFVMDLRSLYDGLAARARSIERLLTEATTLVVTTASPTPLSEATRFYTDLADVAIEPRAVIFNRQLPASWADADPDPEAPAALRDNLMRWGGEARRGAQAATAFVARHDTEVTELPWLPEPPATIEDLDAFLRHAPPLVRLVR